MPRGNLPQKNSSLKRWKSTFGIIITLSRLTGAITAYACQMRSVFGLRGKKYPPALKALIQIRDEKASRLAANEYSLAKKFLRDPERRFLIAKRNFDEGMENAQTYVGKLSKASRRATENIFTEEMVHIITILDKTDDRAAAQAIQAKALSALENPVLRNAIKD